MARAGVLLIGHLNLGIIWVLADFVLYREEHVYDHFSGKSAPDSGDDHRG